MTDQTTPPADEPEEVRHREMGRGPSDPAPARHRDTSRVGLQPDEVPARYDPLGYPTEAVRPASVEAAQGWDERLWHRL